MAGSNNSKTKTFWIVTALAVPVLIFMLFQFNRVKMAIQLSTFIQDLTPAVPRVYLVVSGLVWFGGGLLTVWLLVRRNARAPFALKLIGMLFSANYWTEQLWMTHSELRTVNWPFSAALNAVVLLLLFLILSLKFVRKIFGDHNGRELKNK